MDLNSVQIVGRLVREPEMRYTTGGTAVCDVDVAVNGYKDDEVSFLNVVCWGNTAEAVANNLDKGSQVAVKGELRQDRWETDGGQKRSKVKINAQTVQFLGGGNKPNVNPDDISEEDMPF